MTGSALDKHADRKRALTVHLSNGFDKVIRVFEADEAKAFRLIGSLVAYDLGTLEGRVATKCTC